MKDPFAKIFVSFLSWRIGLFVIAFLASFFLKFNYSFPYINQELLSLHVPQFIWGFGNFDGVHYLRLAQTGYSSEYTQAFFPIFPILIRFFSLGRFYFASGLFISNIFFLIALYFLNKLFLLDFSEKVSFKAIILLLSFPTAFYFGSIYSESIFLLFAVLSIFFARKGNFLISSFFAALGSATRITGIFLWFVILFELIEKMRVEKSLKKGDLLKAILSLLIAPLGLVLYMAYLQLNFNNPIYFLTAQSAFGASRSSTFTLLPQVIYRYLKIFQTVSFRSYPFFLALMEFLFTVVPLVLILSLIKKIRLSYLIFILGCLIMPTLTGTLSSMPRYSLMIFPILPFLASFKKPYFNLTLSVFIILQVILLSLFIRGYFVA